MPASGEIIFPASWCLTGNSLRLLSCMDANMTSCLSQQILSTEEDKESYSYYNTCSHRLICVSQPSKQSMSKTLRQEHNVKCQTVLTSCIPMTSILLNPSTHFFQITSLDNFYSSTPNPMEELLVSPPLPSLTASPFPRLQWPRDQGAITDIAAL